MNVRASSTRRPYCSNDSSELSPARSIIRFWMSSNPRPRLFASTIDCSSTSGSGMFSAWLLTWLRSSRSSLIRSLFALTSSWCPELVPSIQPPTPMTTAMPATVAPMRTRPTTGARRARASNFLRLLSAWIFSVRSLSSALVNVRAPVDSVDPPGVTSDGSDPPAASRSFAAAWASASV